jgi:hypothetical protein
MSTLKAKYSELRTPVSKSSQSRSPNKYKKSSFSPSKPLNSTFIPSRPQNSSNKPSGPLRMSIKLEDIMKTCKNSFNQITLKAELIEPEIDASIPCLDYKRNSSKSRLKEEKYYVSAGGSKTPVTKKVFGDFSLEKMDEDCKRIEENIISTGKKNELEKMENVIESKFNCKVKLVPEQGLGFVPSMVLVKNGETFEIFHVSKV